MKKYLWCEDSGAGYQFWKAIFKETYPDIVVISKKGNTGLRKATKGISDDGNHYYIVIDSALDNPDVLRETRRLYENAKDKRNVSIITIHSFEFALLSFDCLDSWVFAEEDELKEKRKDLLADIKTFVELIMSGGDAEKLSGLKDILMKYNKNNNEQLASKLLYEITRNTGFETDKGELGNCFVIDCCDWHERKEDDICGLDNKRITAKEKANILIEHSVLKAAFRKAGL